MTTQPIPKTVFSIITGKIIEQIENGIIPWQQPWTSAGFPRNLVTGRPYQNINWILLAMLGYERNLFLTFNQVGQLSAKVKKGEKAHMVVYWKVDTEMVIENGEQKEKKKTILRYYWVFNISQCENIPERYIYPVPNPDPEPIHKCAEIVEFMPSRPDIRHEKHEAFYSPKDDYINMPRMETFKSSQTYYGALFHELVHSTGHSSRLNRPEIVNEYSMKSYSTEELTAEIGARYLLSHAGIADGLFENSAAYIQGWLKRLENDPRFIFYASGHAQKAVNYILDIKEQAQEASEAPVTTTRAEEVMDDLPF